MSSMGKKTKSVVGSHTCWADSELSLTPVHNWHVVPFGRKKEELHKRNWGEIHLLLSALSVWRLWKQAGSALSLIIRPAETKVGRRETGRGSYPRNLPASQDIAGRINFQRNWPFDTRPSVAPFPLFPSVSSLSSFTGRGRPRFGGEFGEVAPCVWTLSQNKRRSAGEAPGGGD